MGLTISSIFRKEVRNLVVGLKGAGKTTILCRINNSDSVGSLPTIGFSVKTIEHNGVCFIAWDIGNNNADLPYVKPFYKDARSIIFVVDSNQREKMIEAREELERVLQEDDLRDAPLLILCNKQDLPDAMNTAEITDRLGLHGLRNRTWYIQPTCAITGDGLYEGFEWLGEVMKKMG